MSIKPFDPYSPMQSENIWLSRFSKFIVAFTFGLIFLGGMVTSMNAGLAVPDWPTSFGYNMFTFPISRWVDDVFWEHSHRLVASALGFLIIIQTVWVWRVEKRGWVKWLAVAALLLVIAQGIMGGLRVTKLSIGLAMVHGCTAQMFLCLVTLIAVVLSPAWGRPAPAGVVGRSDAWQNFKKYAWLFTGAVYAQLILGAIMRHLGAGLAIPTFPLMPDGSWYPKVHNAMVDIHFGHRMWAIPVTILCIIVVVKAWRIAAGNVQVTRPALLLSGLIIIQISLGASIIWLQRAPIPTSLHVMNGAAILVTSFILSVKAARFASLAGGGSSKLAG